MSVPSLRWLQIHRYEQFDPVRIEFSGQENLILGINGAGKTRLLRLIRAVLSLDFGDLRDHVFDVEFELETGRGRDVRMPVAICGRVKNEFVDQVATPDDYPQDQRSRVRVLSASLLYESAQSKFSCELSNDIMVFSAREGALTETVSYRGEGSMLPPFRRADGNTELASLVLDMYPVCESTFIGEADHEFITLTGEVEYTAVTSAERMVGIDPLERLGRLLRRDFRPLLFQVALTMDKNSGAAGLIPFPLPNRRSAGEYGEGYEALLNRVQAAIGAKQLRVLPKIVVEKGDLLECRGLGLRVQFNDGAWVRESELTFGQRRYLYAGLMLLSHRHAPFLIDEVDNGLHPRLVETLLKLLAGRQSFLASHNKIVIDYTNFAGPEDVQRKIHIVQRGEDGRQSVLALDEETARNVYEKIEVAIQSPSDVLLAEGLW